jgi:hypothetical protein
MAKKLWYNEKGNECCVFMSLSDWVDRAIDEKRDIHLIEACLDSNGESVCKVDFDFGIVECSRECKDYEPCNKISGKCRHLTKSLKLTGNEFVLDGYRE